MPRRGTGRPGPRPPVVRRSVGTAVVLMAVGGVLAVGVDAPAAVEEYVDVLDLGLILVWSGILLLVMQVVMHRPRRTTARRSSWDDRTDRWYEQDVHRPGYEGETRRLPTVRDGRRR
jgi:hypothetical protein